MRDRKDSKPEDTIKRIKSILSDCGIDTKIVEMHNNEICYSVRVELCDFSGIGTNGKGMTKEYAMASAYGELMERMENGALIDFLFPYKEKQRYCTNFKENVIDNFCDLYQDIDNQKRNKLRNYVSSNLYLSESRKYIDITNNKSVNLPYKLIDILCGTNGLCAGNTYEEAVVQGIEEILERYVLKYIYYNPQQAYHKIMILPKAVYDHFDIYEVIKNIEERGYDCCFLDCTLGGQVPVIGLILYNKKKMLYKFSLASDIDLQIAMQRCITEIFQGIDFNSLFRFSMNSIFDKEHISESIFEHKNVRSNFEKSVIFGNGHLPMYMFAIKKVSSYKWTFGSNIHSNRDALTYLKTLISSLGYSLLIQDNSFLGFPAFKVFIPGLSEIFNDFEKRNIRDKCMTGLSTIDIYNKNHLQELLKNIEQLNTGETQFSLFDIAGIAVKKYDDYIGIDSYEDKHFLLCFLYYHCDMYKEAYYHYENFRSNKNIIPLAYLKFKSFGYSEEIIQELFSNLDIEFDARQYFKIEFPQCPKCSLCHLNKICRYEKWKEIRNMLIYKRRQYENEHFLS